ncbi:MULTISPECIES: bile acid:sodium symporter family protein [Gluconobacter]|uniref:Bile acid:sodium symporter n=1 Tax=Gluconobacter cadivus TaxID=2728101 RepID=A0ABR9YR26_9PROT|nr:MULTISPECIES: bile acid:sodium symporter family protein [Gluconobacter]MBF0886982.1 bile acid:sodium symporter [Gluconobacter cadivus]MBS1059051.1 bile acid:sodium symporter [Gluconobacter sp. Dm-44]
MKRLDPFLFSLICAIALASILPCRGQMEHLLQHVVTILITFMFFFQGAKLERHAIVDSVKDWKLQGSVLLCTFALFPLLGVGLHLLFRAIFPDALFGEELWSGVLFLCCLPSTVQSSIALTSIARGNVTAAICAATVSNIAGIAMTPLLTGLVLGHVGAEHSPLGSILDVSKELLLPFALGQILQKWVGPIVRKHKILISFTDRGSIVVVVYTAFSSAVVEGIWHRVSGAHLLEVALLDSAMLALVLGLSHLMGKGLGQTTSNCIALQFCGSKKSLASGVPMASVIFPAASVGIIVLPLMIYHQIQLFTCTLLARRYSTRFLDTSDQGTTTSPQRRTATP